MTFEDLRHVGNRFKLNDKIHVVRMRGWATGNMIMFCGYQLPGTVLDDEYFTTFNVGDDLTFAGQPMCRTCEKLTS